MASRFVLLCALAALSACSISDDEAVAGRPCQTNADCGGDALYACQSDGFGAQTCQITFPPATSPDGGTPVPTWCADVEPLMVQYCSSCHGETPAAGTPTDFRATSYEDVGSVDGAKTRAERIRIRMTQQPLMPPAGSPQPTQVEINTVVRWVTGGAPFCDGGMP